MEGTQHFSVFVFVLHGLLQSNFSLFVLFGQVVQCWRSLEMCCLATMSAVKSNLFIWCVFQSLPDLLWRSIVKNTFGGQRGTHPCVSFRPILKFYSSESFRIFSTIHKI